MPARRQRYVGMPAGRRRYGGKFRYANSANSFFAILSYAFAALISSLKYPRSYIFPLCLIPARIFFRFFCQRTPLYFDVYPVRGFWFCMFWEYVHRRRFFLVLFRPLWSM